MVWQLQDFNNNKDADEEEESDDENMQGETIELLEGINI
jgi:hypothetical protein